MVRTAIRVSGLDNPGTLQRVREAVATVERSNAGRVSRAQDNAWFYRSKQERDRYQAELERAAHETREERRQREAQAAVQAVEDAEDAKAVAARKKQMDTLAADEHAQWREGPAGRSVGGYAGIVDERIEAARIAGKFKNNKYRGKPLVREAEDYNPYLNREEVRRRQSHMLCEPCQLTPSHSTVPHEPDHEAARVEPAVGRAAERH